LLLTADGATLTASEVTRRNRDVQAALRENNDPLTAARPVEHFAYFGTRQACEDFVQSCQKLGLALAHISEPTERSPQFCVQVNQTGVPIGDAFDELTEQLVLAAEQLGGDYDGWGCPVVPSPRQRGLMGLWSKLRH
jgi:hypothetical protein